VTGTQAVFRYTPVADESTICVVRPFFQLVKKLETQNVMGQGGSAQYTLSVSQIDRSATTTTTTGAYAGLKAQYPWEFGGTTTGTGHRAAGAVVRNNTYARNVVVEDAWEVGLDFSNATDFSGSVSGGVKNTANTTLLKQLSWSAIVDLPMGLTSSASVWLTGNLVSNTSLTTRSPLNGAYKSVTDANLAGWDNCAYVSATQMNQLNGPSNAKSKFISPSATDLVNNVNGTTYQFGPLLASQKQAVERCVAVVVVPIVQPVIGMNVDGEHRAVTPPSGTDAPVFISRSDVFVVGETFKYVYRVENSGSGAALNVAISISASNGATSFGTAAVYRRQSSGAWDINPSSYYVPSTNTATVKAGTIASMAAGDVVYIVIDATAVSQGTQVVTYSVNYSNPPAFQAPALPLVSTDNTTVTNTP
jgi:hypothetical protein